MVVREASWRLGRAPLVLLLAVLSIQLATPAVGQDDDAVAPELVDRVAVIVDEEAILQSDVTREVALYYLEARNAGQDVSQSQDEVREEILQRLIESKLIIAAARQEEIEIADDAVQREVQANIDQLIAYYGSQEALEQALSSEGMTLDSYRKRARSQLRDQHYMRAVIHRFVRPRIEIREEEVDTWYAEHLDEIPATPDSLTLSDILIPVEPEAEVQQEIQRKLGIVLQKLGEGVAFADVAREHSEGPSASRGGLIGRVERGDLYSQVLENAVFSLSPGETGQPLVSERGVHILRVEEADETGRVVSQIFFPLTITDEDVQRAEAYARASYGRIVAGEPFADIATEVSGDPASAAQGGRLGTFALQDLSPTIQEQLDDLQPGQMTEPFLTTAGFYIFLIRERADGQRLDLAEIRDQVRQAVEGEKLELALAQYVGELRERFVVDVKN